MRMLGVAAAMAALLLGTGAAPDARASSERVVEGRIVQEAPDPEGAWCAWLTGGEATQGVIGWVIPLTSQEGDGLHAWELTATGPSGHTFGSPGVAFFAERGTCASSDARVEGVESGLVPYGARYAVIGHWQGGVGLTYSLPPYPYPKAGTLPASTFRFAISSP